MKKIQKVCLSLFMSSVLLASGVISKAINCDVVLSGDEIMPTDLYDVDFDQALQKNLKSADVIVLGDFEFQDTRVSVRTDVSAQTLSETVTVAGNSPELTLKNKVNDGKIKMMVVSEEEIEQQCGESSADVIRHATDNGYVMFFNTSSYEDIHRITADIYEDYGVIYGAKSVNKSTKTIDFAENQNLSYFFVTKTKDNCVDFHFVLSNVKDNPSAVERSMLEHAYANRNMGMYVKNQEEYLASKRAERVRNGDVSSASAKGLLNPTVNGVNFHGDWKRSFNESVFIYEYWHVNYHPDIKHRITVTTCELMSHDLVNGQRLWAQVANIDSRSITRLRRIGCLPTAMFGGGVRRKPVPQLSKRMLRQTPRNQQRTPMESMESSAAAFQAVRMAPVPRPASSSAPVSQNLLVSTMWNIIRTRLKPVSTAGQLLMPFLPVAVSTRRIIACIPQLPSLHRISHARTLHFLTS